MKIRPEIIKFAEQMERVMRTHDKEKGDSWKDAGEGFLEMKLIEEFSEVMKIISIQDWCSFEDELYDVANVCMMLQMVCEPPPETICGNCGHPLETDGNVWGHRHDEISIGMNCLHCKCEAPIPHS